MSYLYGDSTPSTLEINYIEFLRDVVEFCVQVLLADQRILQGRMRTRSLDHTSAAEIDRLQQLQVTVAKALEGMSSGPDSAAVRCAAAIVRASADLVRAEVAAVQSALAAEAGKRDADVDVERRGCIRALEALLARHDLPAMTLDVHLGVQGGTRYACRALMGTGFGLEAILDLDIPENHLYSQVVRVERLVERLEVQAPEMSGWLHKEMKVRAQHLEKHHVTEVSIVDGSGTVKLRVAPDGTGAGFDVMVASDGPRAVRLLRIDEQGEEVGPPFEAREGDDGKLAAFYQKLAAALSEVTRYRRRVVEAKIDGEPMQAVENSGVLVEKLVATIAPVVREIAARSRSSDELVLRRLLGDDRREEIFLSREELRRKLEPLVEGRRALFDPLWLDGRTTGPAPVAAAAPSPAPAAASAPPATAPAPAAPSPRAEPVTRAEVDRATPRAGSLVAGHVRLPVAAAAPPSTPASAAPAVVDPARRPFGSPAFGTRTHTPALGSGSGSASTAVASPAVAPARSPLLGRRFGSPPIGTAAQALRPAAIQPGTKPAAEATPPPRVVSAQPEEAATPAPEPAETQAPPRDPPNGG